MIVQKILLDGTFQPDLSAVDLNSFNILRLWLGEDCETYTVELSQIAPVTVSDKKRAAYEREVDYLVCQYKRYEIIGDVDKMQDVKNKIETKTIEIRARYADNK